MGEREIERNLVKKIEELGGRCIKFVSPGNAGMPDRLILLPGKRACFVETKSTIGRLSPLQKIQHKRLRGLGFTVGVLGSLDDVDDFIRWFL